MPVGSHDDFFLRGGWGGSEADLRMVGGKKEREI